MAKPNASFSYVRFLGERQEWEPERPLIRERMAGILRYLQNRPDSPATRRASRAAGAQIALANGNLSIQKSSSKLRTIISLAAPDFDTEQKFYAGDRTKRHVNARLTKWNTAKVNCSPFCNGNGLAKPQGRDRRLTVRIVLHRRVELAYF